MNKASPIDMRKALEMVSALRSAGILFVPMPVVDAEEAARRVEEAEARLEQMAQEAE